MQTRLSFDLSGLGRNHQTRKLSLNKETLRQLTDGQLRQVAGGVISTVSVSIKPSTVSTSISTSITPSTSINPSGG